MMLSIVFGGISAGVDVDCEVFGADGSMPMPATSVTDAQLARVR